MLKVAGSIPDQGCTDLYCARGAHEGMRVGGNGQSIGTTVCDTIVRGLLWSTATRSYPLGNSFNSITATSRNLTPQSVAVDSPLHGGLLAIEDFTCFLTLVLLTVLDVIRVHGVLGPQQESQFTLVEHLCPRHHHQQGPHHGQHAPDDEVRKERGLVQLSLFLADFHCIRKRTFIQ